MNPGVSEIQQWLARYVAGTVSRESFQRWFVPQTWNVDQSMDPALQHLCGQVELCFAEFLNGDWTEDELKSLLRPFADPTVAYNIHWAPEIPPDVVAFSRQPPYGVDEVVHAKAG